MPQPGRQFLLKHSRGTSSFPRRIWQADALFGKEGKRSSSPVSHCLCWSRFALLPGHSQNARSFGKAGTLSALGPSFPGCYAASPGKFAPPRDLSLHEDDKSSRDPTALGTADLFPPGREKSLLLTLLLLKTLSLLLHQHKPLYILAFTDDRQDFVPNMNMMMAEKRIFPLCSYSN